MAGDANGSGGRLRWEASITPSFLAAVGQLIAMVVGGTMLYSNITNSVANTVQVTHDLKSASDRQDVRQQVLSERLVKVETNVSTLTDTVNKIDSKIDTLRK